jgi:hypothetical protein
MPFYYCSKSFVPKMVSSQKSRTTREEKAKWVAIGGGEEERDSDGEVHKTKRPLNPIHISPKKAKEPKTKHSKE